MKSEYDFSKMKSRKRPDTFQILGVMPPYENGLRRTLADNYGRYAAYIATRIPLKRQLA